MADPTQWEVAAAKAIARLGQRRPRLSTLVVLTEAAGGERPPGQVSPEWRLRESLDGGWLSAFAELRRGLIVPRSEEIQYQAWRRHHG
jgi:hypothetical protein